MLLNNQEFYEEGIISNHELNAISNLQINFKSKIAVHSFNSIKQDILTFKAPYFWDFKIANSVSNKFYW